MRRQYNFWPGDQGLDAWDVHRLIALTRDMPARDVSLSDIAEIDSPYWYGFGETPTVRSIAEHVTLVNEADLSFPIILSASGRVMDGMHRIVKALVNGHLTISAVQFDVDPEPDYQNCDPDTLPYDDIDLLTTTSPEAS